MIARRALRAVEQIEWLGLAPGDAHPRAEEQAPALAVERALQVHLLAVIGDRGVVKAGRQLGDHLRLLETAGAAGVGPGRDEEPPAVLRLAAEVEALAVARQPRV